MSSKVITPVVHRENGHVEIEFKAEFDGNLIGYFPTHAQAENELNQHVLDLCERGLVDQPLGLQAEQALIGACAVRCNCAACAEPEGPDSPYPPHGPGDDDPSPGRAIYRQFHRDRARFLAVLRNLDRDAWRPLVEAYCAYLMRVGRPAIDPDHVLRVWAKAVEGDTALPARVHPLLVKADASSESYANP